MDIDATYVPAIITGVTSLSGIIANIIINSLYRISDKEQRKFEQEKEALESYFTPLYIYTSRIESVLRDLLDEKDIVILSNYLKGTIMISPEKNVILIELISYIENAIHYIHNRQYKKLSNSKIIIDSYIIIVDFLEKAYKSTQGEEHFINYNISFSSLLESFNEFNTAIYKMQ